MGIAVEVGAFSRLEQAFYWTRWLVPFSAPEQVVHARSSSPAARSSNTHALAIPIGPAREGSGERSSVVRAAQTGDASLCSCREVPEYGSRTMSGGFAALLSFENNPKSAKLRLICFALTYM